MLHKELLLTLSCLKDLGIKGIGPQKIFLIANSIGDHGKTITSLEYLQSIISNRKENIFRNISWDDLRKANEYAKALIYRSTKMGVDLMGFYDDEYPQMLRECKNEYGKLEPPILLWYRGDISVLNMPKLAVIGTREITEEGKKSGMYLSREFANMGLCLVSGLAIGCDTCGHIGALESNHGKTIAILANGLDYDSIYPKENRDLAEHIVTRGGLLLSEYKIGSRVNRYSLIARDRLQAGISNATLVIQTGIIGGTMHTVNATIASNKPLYAVQYKDQETNNLEKCLGNSFLISKKLAKPIMGSSNLNDVGRDIINTASIRHTLF